MIVLESLCWAQMCESVLGSEIHQVGNLVCDDYETAAESNPMIVLESLCWAQMCESRKLVQCTVGLFHSNKLKGPWAGYAGQVCARLLL